MKNEITLKPSTVTLKTDQERHEFLEDTRELSVKSSIAQILLAERLYRIREEKLWQTGYDSFDEYCMNLKLYNAGAISKLITVYKTFILDYGIDREKAAEVGYTVLYKAHKVIEDKEDAEEFVNNAMIWTGSDINREIAYRKSGNPVEDCKHENTYMVRICKDCGERWQDGEHLHTDSQ